MSKCKFIINMNEQNVNWRQIICIYAENFEMDQICTILTVEVFMTSENSLTEMDGIWMNASQLIMILMKNQDWKEPLFTCQSTWTQPL